MFELNLKELERQATEYTQHIQALTEETKRLAGRVKDIPNEITLTRNEFKEAEKILVADFKAKERIQQKELDATDSEYRLKQTELRKYTDQLKTLNHTLQVAQKAMK